MNTRGKRNERGASAVEYGLMIALCVLVFATSLAALGGGISAVFECAEDDMESSAGTSCF